MPSPSGTSPAVRAAVARCLQSLARAGAGWTAKIPFLGGFSSKLMLLRAVFLQWNVQKCVNGRGGAKIFLSFVKFWYKIVCCVGSFNKMCQWRGELEICEKSAVKSHNFVCPTIKNLWLWKKCIYFRLLTSLFQHAGTFVVHGHGRHGASTLAEYPCAVCPARQHHPLVHL